MKRSSEKKKEKEKKEVRLLQMYLENTLSYNFPSAGLLSFSLAIVYCVSLRRSKHGQLSQTYLIVEQFGRSCIK